jgi:hypothetical protein
MSSPYLFSIWSLFWHNQTSTRIPPIIVNHNNCHQPDLFTSWSLLAPTASSGISKINDQRRLNQPMGSFGSVLVTSTPKKAKSRILKKIAESIQNRD